jgi:hypothetical protein
MRRSHTPLVDKKEPESVNSSDYQCELCEIVASNPTSSDAAYGFKKLKIPPVKRSFCPERYVVSITPRIISLVTAKVNLVVTTSATEAHGQNHNCVAEHTFPVPKAWKTIIPSQL